MKTIKHGDLTNANGYTNKVSHINKKVGWLKSAIKFITLNNCFNRMKEEERDNEMLIRKAGYWSG